MATAAAIIRSWSSRQQLQKRHRTDHMLQNWRADLTPVKLLDSIQIAAAKFSQAQR